MKFLFLNWKEKGHPLAGGAELVMHELCTRLVRDGHKVTILTSMYPDAKKHEFRNGINYIRIGSNRYLHSFQALFYYLRHLRNNFDIVVENVNTAPYFAINFLGSSNGVLLYHQLAQEIWFYETAFPLDYIGRYILEPVATWLLKIKKPAVIAMSKSTKKDLVRAGHKPENVHVISEGIDIKPVKEPKNVNKYNRPALLSLGAVRGMKRTLEQIKAFETAKKDIPNLRLYIAGGTNGAYANKVESYIAASPFKSDIELLGQVTEKKKLELMQKSHVLLVTSIKEGWCLVVTETNSQGTPAVVYDADGLRDSVKHRKTGIITKENTPQELAKSAVTLFKDPKKYKILQKNAWEFSKTITFEQCYMDFQNVIKRL